jgi:repressor LexA
MLNERGREILEYIRCFQRDKGYPPTIREIGEKFQIASTNGVRYHLNILQKEGHLSRRSRISRGTTTVTEGIPVLGRVAAGQPLFAEESFEGTLEPGTVFGDTAGLFALRVKGDSMTGAGIFPDDYVIVRRQGSASSGEMVVALIGEDATVKFYRPRADRVELVAANPAYQPIQVEHGQDLRLLGVVRGVIRTVGK